MKPCSIKPAALLALCLALSGPAYSQAPNCAKARPGSLEFLLCRDEALSALDKKMAETLLAAEPVAAKERPPMLKAEQRGWTRMRDECLKAEDKNACLHLSYTRRIAELQASYQLLPATGSSNYRCGSNPGVIFKAVSFASDPPTLAAEFDENTSVLYLKPGGAGTSYASDQVTFLERDGVAKIVWGPGNPEMTCKREP
jgi:uncharacterized protein